MNELSLLRSPREKITSIVNFLNYIVSKFKLTENSYILKFAVFAILKSNIPNIKENLKFISLFRHKTIISSEEDYFLSIMTQVLEYIEKMSFSTLKINKSEFIEKCEDFEKKEILTNNTKSKYSIYIPS